MDELVGWAEAGSVGLRVEALSARVTCLGNLGDPDGAEAAAVEAVALARDEPAAKVRALGLLGASRYLPDASPGATGARRGRSARRCARFGALRGLVHESRRVSVRARGSRGSARSLAPRPGREPCHRRRPRGRASPVQPRVVRAAARAPRRGGLGPRRGGGPAPRQREPGAGGLGPRRAGAARLAAGQEDAREVCATAAGSPDATARVQVVYAAVCGRLGDPIRGGVRAGSGGERAPGGARRGRGRSSGGAEGGGRRSGARAGVAAAVREGFRGLDGPPAGLGDWGGGLPLSLRGTEAPVVDRDRRRAERVHDLARQLAGLVAVREAAREHDSARWPPARNRPETGLSWGPPGPRVRCGSCGCLRLSRCVSPDLLHPACDEHVTPVADDERTEQGCLPYASRWGEIRLADGRPRQSDARRVAHRTRSGGPRHGRGAGRAVRAGHGVGTHRPP